MPKSKKLKLLKERNSVNRINTSPIKNTKRQENLNVLKAKCITDKPYVLMKNMQKSKLENSDSSDIKDSITGMCFTVAILSTVLAPLNAPLY